MIADNSKKSNLGSTFYLLLFYFEIKVMGKNTLNICWTVRMVSGLPLVWEQILGKSGTFLQIAQNDLEILSDGQAIRRLF